MQTRYLAAFVTCCRTERGPAPPEALRAAGWVLPDADDETAGEASAGAGDDGPGDGKGARKGDAAARVRAGWPRRVLCRKCGAAVALRDSEGLYHFHMAIPIHA
jgi:hypothetical protein